MSRSMARIPELSSRPGLRAGTWASAVCGDGQTGPRIPGRVVAGEAAAQHGALSVSQGRTVSLSLASRLASDWHQLIHPTSACSRHQRKSEEPHAAANAAASVEPPGLEEVQSEEDAHALLEELTEFVRAAGARAGGANVVAFSGGVDSSLTAYLVHRAFKEDHSVLHAACIGISPSLATWQLETARQVAQHIGIPLWEVATAEGQVPEYLANEGQSCFHCKMSLYSSLSAVAVRAAEALQPRAEPTSLPSISATYFGEMRPQGSAEAEGSCRHAFLTPADPASTRHYSKEAWGAEEPIISGDSAALEGLSRESGGQPGAEDRVADNAASAVPWQQFLANKKVVLFNGTNADDLKDPTRLGLLAAIQFRVASPLASLPKASVRALARAAGLPNSELAASPCLRSRLQLGVPATQHALEAVGDLEREVRTLLQVKDNENFRVRVLLDAAEEAQSQTSRMNSHDGGSSAGSNVTELSNVASGFIHDCESEEIRRDGTSNNGSSMRQETLGLDGYRVVLEVEGDTLCAANTLEFALKTVVKKYGARYGGTRQFKSGSLSYLRTL